MVLKTADYILKNVYIVDDEQGMLSSLERVLEFNGYMVTSFTSGEETLAYLENNPLNFPELIISDYQLNNHMDGIELFKKIREDYPEISVLMITGYGTKEILIDSLRAGIDDYLDKPVSPEELIESITTIKRKRISVLKREKEYFSQVIHELKHPITNIIMNSEHYTRHISNDEQSFQFGEDVSREALRLDEMIEELLNPAEYLSNRVILNCKQHSMRSIMDYIDNILTKISRQKNIRINTECENDITVYLDRNKIIRVLFNLGLNAIHNSPSDSEIIISAAKVSNTSINIKVADTGCGISEFDKSKIFSFNYRANENYKGKGIGLFVVKSIVKAHRGFIKVKDNSPQGSIFEINLPVSQY